MVTKQFCNQFDISVNFSNVSPDTHKSAFGGESKFISYIDEAPTKFEPHFLIELKDVSDFAAALEIVRYANKNSSQGYQDVVLIAEKRGIHLKSASKSGTIISTVEIKPKIFSKYEFYWPVDGVKDGKENIGNNENIANMPNQTEELQQQLHTATVVNSIEQSIEFCIPFNELRHIVECLTNDQKLTLIYPMRDQQLAAIIEEDLIRNNQSQSKKTKSEHPAKTCSQTMLFDVYNGGDNLNFSYDFASPGIALNVFSTVKHFKNALKEFQPYEDSNLLELGIQTSAPRISFKFEQGQFVQLILFREDLEEFIINQSSDHPFTALYTLESLRLGLSRAKNDKNVLAFKVNMNGMMCVKIMPENRNFLATSLIMPQQEEDD